MISAGLRQSEITHNDSLKKKYVDTERARAKCPGP